MNETVYREDGRIRQTSGSGYGDMVSDDQIRQHIANHEDDPKFVAFAEAVLAIRAFERLS